MKEEDGDYIYTLDLSKMCGVRAYLITEILGVKKEPAPST